MGNDTHSPPTTPKEIERKLAAILSADVQGFSRLMRENEEATLRTLQTYREVTDALIQHYRGRIVGTAGDSILAEFASVMDTVRCAVEIQHQLKTRNAELPEHRRMEFRIGINLGDVMVDGEQIYGDGVNIAARLQTLAEAGGIYISGTVHEQIKNKLALRYEDLGEQTVKNIIEPVRVWRVQLEEAESSTFKVQRSKQRSPDEALRLRSGQAPRNLGRTPIPGFRYAPSRLLLVGLILILGGLGTVWYLSSPSIRIPQSEIRNQAEPAPALPLPDKPSIVVLPFVNMSKDPEQEYFSDGITEVLTSDLSRISSLFLIARNTAFTYKGKPVNMQEVGRELGVRYVVEGSVQKASDQVRIVAQLIDTTSGGHIWSERYDRPLKDIFALQDEITQKIVFALKVKLTKEEQERFRRAPTDSLEAYDYLLRGGAYFSRLTKEANAQARQLYEKAIELDPQYAAAYAWLGWTYWLEWVWQWSPDPQSLERAFELAQKAVALDDSLPAAHGLLGYVYVWKKQYEQAIAEGERAIALDPNYADAYSWLAEILNTSGRPQNAIGLIETAMRLNPRYPPNYLFKLGWAYNLTGRFEEAIAALKQVVSRNPNFLTAHTLLASSYLQAWAGQWDQDPQILERAFESVQRALALNDSLSHAHGLLGLVHLWNKRPEQALAEGERAIALNPGDAGSYVTLGHILAYTGRPQEAVGLIEKAMHLNPRPPAPYSISLGLAYNLAGRYEEAITILKRALTRIPIDLGSHVQLAVAYSELGREEEARAEAAEVLRINPKFSLEVMRQRAPIKDSVVLERHLAALRKAGLK